MNAIQRVVFAAGIGSMLEMYDFVVYGLIAVILGQLFFPNQNHLISVMASFGVFASGFLARPAGSLFFGHFGDRLGRRNVLVFTIILMALASFLIAIVPTYHHIGLWAPVLLIIFRLLQGFAVGGEFAGAVTFIAEYSAENQRGYRTAWTFFFVNMGIVLASGITSLASTAFSSAQFASWGWRLLFVIGGLLAIVGLYVRQKIAETPLFIEVKQKNQLAELPLAEIFTSQRLNVLKGCGICIVASVFVGMILMFMPSYLALATHMSLKEALSINTMNVLLLSILIPIFGMLSDRVGKKAILMFGCLGLTVFSYLFFKFLNETYFLAKLVGLVGLTLFGASILGVFGALLANLFPTNSRYTCIAFSYNVPFALLAGTAPVVSLYLIHASGNVLTPAFYLSVAALVSLLMIAFGKNK